jgi:hypothetical protein
MKKLWKEIMGAIIILTCIALGVFAVQQCIDNIRAARFQRCIQDDPTVCDSCYYKIYGVHVWEEMP